MRPLSPTTPLLFFIIQTI